MLQSAQNTIDLFRSKIQDGVSLDKKKLGVAGLTMMNEETLDSMGRRVFDEKGRYRAFRSTYEEFEKFLMDRPKRRFDQDCPHSCAGAECCGNELREMFCGPEWFNQFQRKVKGGIWTGKELLSVLREVGPGPAFGQKPPKGKRK